MRFLVGTYTRLALGPTGSRGVYLCDLDLETLQVTVLDSVEVANPSYVAVLGDMAYALTECGAESYLHSIAIEGERLRLTSTVKSPGDDPCHLLAVPGRVYTANYTGGSIAVVAIEPDDTLGDTVQHLHMTEHGTSPRQLEAHMHNLALSPGGRTMAASNLGGDCVYLLGVGEDGRLTRLDTCFTPAGSGPRHLAWNQDGSRLYLITELSEELITFEYHENRLLLKQIDVAARTVHPGGGDIHLHPSGHWLYTTVRNMDDGITHFELDDNGMPQRRAFYPCGRHPRNFAITPDGSQLLCACRDDNAIEIYRISPLDGSLNLASTVSLPAPVCIAWM